MKNIRIYVASLSDYNAGILHGAWIDVESYSQVMNEILQILKTTKTEFAEEWAIHDFEGFGAYDVCEYSDIKNLCLIVQLIEEHGEIITDYQNQTGCDLEELEDKFSESYQGQYDRLTEWASDYLDETGQLEGLPENLRYYFDYDSFIKDLEINGDILAIHKSKGVHVFWNI